MAINAGNPEALAGWAMPVATDIAFALGILALLGPRVPSSLKVFLTALAVLDDLLVVLIIVLFYTGEGSLLYLLFAGIGLVVLIGMNLLGGSLVAVYLLVGAMVWFCALRSGIHPTLAGVPVAFTVPWAAAMTRPRLRHCTGWSMRCIPGWPGSSYRCSLSPMPVLSFGDIPWAMVGAGPDRYRCRSVPRQAVRHRVVGMARDAPGISRPPKDATYRHIHGVATVCGVGFTMCLYIGSLAFDTGSGGGRCQGRRAGRIAAVRRVGLHRATQCLTSKRCIAMTISAHNPSLPLALRTVTSLPA